MLLCSILKLLASVIGLTTALINLYRYLDAKEEKLQDKQKNNRH